MTKTVLVCGDLVWDTHIARLPKNGRGYTDPQTYTQLKHRVGGAWYLRDVIKECITAQNTHVAEKKRKDPSFRGRRIIARLVGPTRVDRASIESDKCPAGIAKAFSVWKWFEGKERPATAKYTESDDIRTPIEVSYKWPKGEAQPGAWRIAEFLGCQEASWKLPIPYPGIKDEPSDIDVLVIDDLGLGFNTHREIWPTCLREPGNLPGAIIVKGGAPFRSPLWKHLLDPGSRIAELVTLVTTVESLRDMGANVARGMSWDRTIEDLQREFSSTGTGRELLACARVVVTCGHSGAAVFSRFARSPAETLLKPDQAFERFVFDPLHLEGSWANQYEGRTFGTGSIVTSEFVVHSLLDSTARPSTHIPVGRALSFARELHCYAGGHKQEEFRVTDAAELAFRQCSCMDAWTQFKSAFPRELLDAPILTRGSATPGLLTDAVGTGKSFLTVTAEDIVRCGYDHVLEVVPKLKCGEYFTVDREEIENLNTVRNLIHEYCEGQNANPLSIAVFGAPGCGKSFATKQLAEDLFGEQRAVLEFNLSQFNDLDDLHEAFQEVRDKSVKGQMPFVFWDEFDCKRRGEDLGWLKEFLAPMQDANFQANGKSHPFGRCVFIFAGGTSPSFHKFDRSHNVEDTKFKNVKGPDFVSRLRGYVNIKGPNPVEGKEDDVSIIRRSILLRSLIKRHHPQAIHPVTKKLIIDPRLLAAFLGVERYLHGSRSMEAIVSLSHLHENPNFGPSDLPPREVLQLHASRDFSLILSQSYVYRLSPEDVERLAELIHTTWRDAVKNRDYKRGTVRNGDPRKVRITDPRLVDYADLPEADKDANRLPARLALMRLMSLGYRIVTGDREHDASPAEVATSEQTKLAQSEHRRWMREKLMQGYSYAANTDRDLMLHTDICKWDDLKEAEKTLDNTNVKAIFQFIKENGLALVRK